METGLTLLPTNHSTALSLMHPHAAGLMKAKYEGQKISGLIAEQLVPAVRIAIQDCIKSLGHWDTTKDSEVLEHQTTEMVGYFLRDFKNLTIQEFRIILRNMVKGDYRAKETDLIVCSVQSMCHAIKSYLASQEYKMAFTDYQNRLKLDVPTKKDPSKEEQEMLIQKGLDIAVKKFKEAGEFPSASSCHVFYRHMKKRGELILTEEAKAGYLANAKVICERTVKEKRGAMTSNEYKEAVEKLGSGNSVKLKAMELAFKDYLTNNH